MVFRLPLRQTEGFLQSLIQLLELDLPIPDDTTLSRRLKRLDEICGRWREDKKTDLGPLDRAVRGPAEMTALHVFSLTI